MSATAVGEVSFTLTSVSGCCPTERRLPFLLTCGQELEKCVLGTEMILLSGFSHEQMGELRDHGLLGGAWTFLNFLS